MTDGLNTMWRRPALAVAGAATLVAAHLARPALAQSQGPMPFEYTDFAESSETDSDRFWRGYYGEEREVALHQASFAAHFTIQRDASQQAFAIFYSPRVCADLKTVNGATLSKCPARFTRFFPSRALPDVVNLPDDVCIVRFGDTPPLPSQFGWNATQATLRKIDGQSVLILSAVVAGELISECTKSVPLGAP
ncbi:hypothetical protein SAMN05519103_08610 [Rhizobiales bacterium GAS113]|nr:hypothetical protein SAMN05519103_08610 [Rhizobiales bacterium GAS113]